MGASVYSLDAPEAARGDRLVNKVQADSAKTALAGIPYIKPCPCGMAFIYHRLRRRLKTKRKIKKHIPIF